MTDSSSLGPQTFTARLVGYRTHTPGLTNDHRVELQIEVDNAGLHLIHQAYGLGVGQLEITHRPPEWVGLPEEADHGD